MAFTRPARRLAATIAVAVMLFAQFAIAAHACAAIAGASLPHESMAMSHGDSPCEETAPAPEKVCLEHCAGEQSVDNHPASPAVPALAPMGTVAQADASDLSLHSTQSYSHALLARVTAPPLAVRHCCFRT
jgi:hypothetical protein